MSRSEITLTNPTADELSAAVAEYVAGWRRVPPPCGKKREWSHILLSPGAREWGNDYKGQYIVVWKDGDLGGDVPKWATSADAVLPLLEKYDAWSKGTTGGAVTVYKLVLSPAKKPSEDIPDAEWMMLKPVGHYWNCQNPKPFPYSACIALLRANGIKVVTTH